MPLIPPAAPARASSAVSLACLLAATPLAWAADPYVGATIDTQATYYTLTCGTCPIDTGTEDNTHQGGPGTPSASHAATAPGWSLSASARLDGPNGLPVLGGFGFTDIVTNSVPTTFFYKTGTFSQGLQRYDYSGTVATTYQIDFTLAGSFTLARADAASLMSAMGGYTVYGADYNPVGEYRGTVLGTQFVNDRASLAGTEAFALPGSISFNVNPGDAFYVWGALSVSADSSHQVIGSVDASHTLGAQFTQGDVSLLSAAVPAVPELPSQALLLAGLATLGWLRARRGTRRET